MTQVVDSPRSPALDAAGRQLLEQVARTGPLPPGELPRRWPMTRHLSRLLVRALAREGLVEHTRENGGPPRLALTEAGKAVLAEQHS